MTALDIDRLNIASGKITAIVGPNGAGKSTLLNLIGNLIQKDVGRILYNGVEKVPEKDITLVFQEPYLIASTVKNNIAYPMKLRKFSKEAIGVRTQELAQELNLGALLNKREINCLWVKCRKWLWQERCHLSRNYCFWTSPVQV